MEFRVLGPLEVCTAGGEVRLTGPKRRALLAIFLINARETLSIDRLSDALWNGTPPRSAYTTLATFVYQLRRRYGIEALRTTPAGYVLDTAADCIDASRFERLVREARALTIDRPGDALQTLRDALAMWRGSAYAEFASEPWGVAEAARLEQLRLETVESFAVAAMGAHETSGLLGELEAWTNRQPLRESLWALRMIALAREGRSAEALRVATNLRAVLAEELGVDPGSEFTAIEGSIIRGEGPPAWPELGGFGLRSTTTAAAIPVAGQQTETSLVLEERARFFSEPPRPARGAPRGGGVKPQSAAPDDFFVGRASELQILENALEFALDGLPQTVLLIGDAGIGKSRLLDEFMPRAISRGVRVLFGACQEDIGIPYLPIAAALAGLYDAGGQNPFEAGDHGTGGARDAPRIEDVSAADVRLRLFLSASRALLDAVAQRPTILVVEDLHWVDDATLSFLKYLVSVIVETAVIKRSQLLMIVTSRELETASAAGNFVARLARENRSHWLSVGPLRERECRELIASSLNHRPTRATVERLIECTGGNPLVLRSALRRLHAAGGGKVTDSALADLLGTTDLDHELWCRVEDVSDACGEMLLNAAFLGDGSTLEALAAAGDVDTETLDELIDEASNRRVVAADDERYWFDHPQLRQLIYHWPAADERAARHLQIAERIGPDGADLMLVAHHLVRAGDRAAPPYVLDVCSKAAERAAGVGAWRDAARYWASALSAGQVLDLPPENLANMQLRAGYAALLGQDREAGLIHLNVAAECAEACGEIATWGRAVAYLAREAVNTAELRQVNVRSIKRLDDFLVVAGDREPALRAEVHALLAELHFAENDLAAAQRHTAISERIAVEVSDDEVRVKLDFAQGLRHLGAIELDDASARFEAACTLARTLTDPSPRIWCVSRLGLIGYMRGELDLADPLLTEALDTARDFDLRAEYSMACAVAASVATVEGRSATAESHSDRANRAYLDAEYWFTPSIVFPTLAAARAFRGDGPGAHRALDEWDTMFERRSRRYRPLVDALVGDLIAARKALDAQTFRLFTGVPAPNLLLNGALAAQVELAALLRMPALIRGPVEALMELYERGVCFTVGWPALVPRVVALALAAIERPDEADEWFERALADARSSRAVAEVARTSLDHARFLADRGEAATRIDDRLRSARDAYASLSVQPSVAGSEMLGFASAPSRAANAIDHVTRIVLITDVVGSTALNTALGDRAYLELLKGHDEVVRRRLAECDGVEFKHTGDGIAAWFFSVDRALRCALLLEQDFSGGADGFFGRLRVRIGLSAGAPSLVEGDLLGLAVTLAFRVLDVARPGEVLVTSDVAGLARGLDWSFERRGSHRLKGMHEEVALFRVRASARG